VSVVPELPDIVIYLESLEQRILGHTLQHIKIQSPALLRTAVPPIHGAEDKKVVHLRRLGKRICLGLDGDFWLVLHLMIAGRLHWKTGSSGKSNRRTSAVFEFDNGTLSLTEAGTQKRASLHLVTGEDGLRSLDPGGLEVLSATLDEFGATLRSDNHTLKRALTDPRILSGIGNAYSDEILWTAQLSPLALTQKLSPEEMQRLFKATQSQLTYWTERLRQQSSGAFPEKVTAFREGMAVHGRFKEMCPRCGSKIQRIRYAANETNYCPNCQTKGKLLADRSLSRLLRGDWPRTPEELEAKTRGAKE
jgi:formamidopyrimidine-DNA glycosylase